MKLLVDECLSKKLKRDFPEHHVHHITQTPWRGLKNGALLRQIEHQIDVLITIDGNLEHQQNYRRFRIGFVVLKAPSNAYVDVQPLVPEIKKVLAKIQPGELYNVK